MMLYYAPGISASSSSEFINITHVQHSTRHILTDTLNVRKRVCVTGHQPGHLSSHPRQEPWGFSAHAE